MGQRLTATTVAQDEVMGRKEIEAGREIPRKGSGLDPSRRLGMSATGAHSHSMVNGFEFAL